MTSLLRIVLFLVALVGGRLVSAPAPVPARPNIVVFLTDDHSVLDSTIYGSTEVRTPNMERIARAGLVFDRAFVVSPSCAPSRAALLTGLYPARNGAEPNHSKPRADIKKLPAYFHELGYEVAAIGKVAHYSQSKDYGFDYWAHDKFHEDIAVPAAIEWLRNRKSEKPLVLFVGTNWPHTPWPKTPDGFDPDKLTIPVTHVDTPTTREARARYYTAIAIMDRELGEVYDAAREVLGKDTFFLTSSDNGAQWPFGKWNCYDAGIHEPMIAVWPGRIPPGQRTQAMVSWIDVLPTLLEVAGGTPPADIDGMSFAAVLRGAKTTHRDRIFTTHSADKNMNIYPIRSLRTADWLYIWNLHPEFAFTSHVDLAPADTGYFDSWVDKAKTDPAAAATVHRYHARPAEELYDLHHDPFGQNNLADRPEHLQRVKDMHADVAAWMNANHDEGRVYGNPRLPEPDQE